jgi:hypothetical protein
MICGIGLYAQTSRLFGDPIQPFLVWLALTAPLAWLSPRPVVRRRHGSMRCPEPALAVESWFLGALARAKECGLLRGQLAIVYLAADGNESRLLFQEVASPTTD